VAKSLADKLKDALVKPVKKAIDNFNKQLNKGTLEEFKIEVESQIKRGISPVEGIKRFDKYSESYREAIKEQYGEAKKKKGKVSPVDMTLSGDMLDSLKVVNRSGKTYLEFTGKETGLRAYYHNDSGAGKSRKIRRLLPDKDGEKFNSVLQRTLVRIIKEIVKKTRIKS
jgi:hypothetical protein